MAWFLKKVAKKPSREFCGGNEAKPPFLCVSWPGLDFGCVTYLG